MRIPLPLFLGWDEPWLPRLAHYLLAQQADLSKTVVVLPGKRAGRRLLELLALQAQEQSQLLHPPAIMTLEEAANTLLEIPNALPVAGKGISLLAWRQAALQLTLQELQDIQSLPEGMIASANTGIFAEAPHRVAALGERLALELGKAGFSIEEVLLRHTPFFPESADREEPRWRALAKLQKEYQKILASWDYVDRSESLKQKLHRGEYRDDKSVIIAGVVDFSPLFVSFFEKINPKIIIIAPEGHAAGFDPHGRIVPSYWLEHPAEVPEEILIPCERSRDQAAKTWEVIEEWRKAAPENSVVIVAPDAEALPLLREAGAAIGLQTRWAGGRPFQGSSLFLLLEAFKKFLTRIFHTSHSEATEKADGTRRRQHFDQGCMNTCCPDQNSTTTQYPWALAKLQTERHEISGLDRTENKSPSIVAVADLLRHPIVAKKLSASLEISSELLLRELDNWEREHLPLFLEEDHLKQFHKEETLGALLQELENHFVFALEAEPLEQVLQQWRALLDYLLGQEKIRRTDPEGHFFLECFEKMLLLLEELEELTASTKLCWSGSALLSFLLEMLSKESIPELEQPQATEIIGWLEAAAEDIPGLVLTSCHEGAVPAAPTSDPLLSERLRKKLGLGSTEDQLARDHYYLQLILHPRKKEGGIAILAPRHNGRNEPVRPSRLLLQGCSENTLPSRILALTQRHQSIDRPISSASQQDHHSLFSARPVEPLLIERLNVTALKTYLRSPRLFYLKHVLKLREVLETPVEMTPPQFGVLLHRILADFSAEASLREEKQESIFCHWLEKALARAFQWQFGKNPSPAVSSQQGEILRALKGFARAEALHRAEGWQTIAVEGKGGDSSLLEKIIVLEDDRSLILQGRIDRLDWHPEKKRWLLLDYKTSHHQEWKKETPNRTHFQRRGDAVVWHDLQLPLYLKLAPQLSAIQASGLPLPTMENTDLCFFQLPIHPEAAGISEIFDAAMIQPAWQEAERIIRLILDGAFEEVGTLDAGLSPTWKALCGIK